MLPIQRLPLHPAHLVLSTARCPPSIFPSRLVSLPCHLVLIPLFFFLFFSLVILKHFSLQEQRSTALLFPLCSTFPRLCGEASWEPRRPHFPAFSSVATQCRVVCSHRHLLGQDPRRTLSPISGNLPKWILNGQTLSTTS